MLFSDDEAVERYLEEHSTDEDPVLKELARHTYLKKAYPRMLSGPILGSFLTLFSRLLAPERILEIGTYTGYSAICLARGLRPGGKLITIEINDEFHNTARTYFRKANLQQQIELIHGNALDILPTLDGGFNLVFMDAHKEDYSAYYSQVIDKVVNGGYILADNVLWGGKVMDPGNTDPATQAIDRFNKMVVKDPRVDNFMLPVRDGLMVIRKRAVE